MDSSIALFPLNAVLFPQGILPLKIFEARYLDMVANSLKHDVPFGICRIVSGKEVGEAPEVEQVGTLANIINWDRRQDGLLEIVVQGQQRFRILDCEVHKDQSLHAEIELIEPEPDGEIPRQYQILRNILAQIQSQMEATLPGYSFDPESAVSLSYRLSELLPVPGGIKQALLEMDNPVQRLEKIALILSSIDSTIVA